MSDEVPLGSRGVSSVRSSAEMVRLTLRWPLIDTVRAEDGGTRGLLLPITRSPVDGHVSSLMKAIPRSSQKLQISNEMTCVPLGMGLASDKLPSTLVFSSRA